MANVIGKFQDEIEQTGGEVVQDIKDSVGEAIEQGIQSATSPQLTPQQLQQKQQEDQQKEIDRQKQLAYTRRWLSDLTVAQQKVRMENKQKEQQRLQAQQQEEQVAEMEKEEKKKQPINPAIVYAGKAEIKRGVGG
ncbi:hypothetical protein HYU93_04685 [Candidatus Daviesbacteria bacterium]|nr:hypothetical protein [Candidatus Daviesbacteria bacterium]